VLVSQYPGHITRASSELAARGSKVVVACGGDGTVSEVINGIAGTDTAMGVVPTGHCNNFATALGISTDITLACQAISEGHQRTTDLIRVNGERLIAGTGFLALDSEVGAFTCTQQQGKSLFQSLRRMASLLKALSFETKTVELRFEGNRFFGEVLLVTFRNRVPATASVKENRALKERAAGRPTLEVCVVESVPWWRRIARLASAGKPTQSEQKGITTYQTDAVHVQSLRPLGFYSNEDFITNTPFRLQVIANHLNVIAPSV
jgi:diacylglycerol kinase family enzyme